MTNKDFKKELDQRKKGYSTHKERIAFLEGAEFVTDWQIEEGRR